MQSAPARMELLRLPQSFSDPLVTCMKNLQKVSGSRQDTPLDLCLEFEDSKDSKIQSTFALDPTSLSILKEIERRGDTKAKELVEVLHLSRGPILGRLKKLSEKGLLSRSVQPGTERKSKPTYIYRLASSLQTSSEIASLSNTDKQETSIEVMAELLEAAIQEIATLKSRMSRVENALALKSSLDREELLSKLKS